MGTSPWPETSTTYKSHPLTVFQPILLMRLQWTPLTKSMSKLRISLPACINHAWSISSWLLNPTTQRKLLANRWKLIIQPVARTASVCVGTLHLTRAISEYSSINMLGGSWKLMDWQKCSWNFSKTHTNPLRRWFPKWRQSVTQFGKQLGLDSMAVH
jgi:hypothetical protein